MILGIDIGGTKISVCIGDESGRIKASRRMPVADAAGSYDAGRQKIIRLCQAVIEEAGLDQSNIAAIGIAAPGPLDSKAGMLLAPTNLQAWGHAPIVADLESHFKLPVLMQNDANACALAEFQFGCGRDKPRPQTLVYLTNSTGMGGGLIIHGKLLEGNDDTAGEVGHFVLDPEGPLCACGQQGCFEAYCGGVGMANRIRERIRADNINTRILDHAGGDIEKIAIPALLAALRENDHFAQNIWNEYIMRMAQGISIIIMTLNPEMVVLGTIAIHAGDLQMKPLREQLARFTWPAPLNRCRILTSRLAESVGDFSALAVAINALEKQ